jgi:hypothetical protein
MLDVMRRTKLLVAAVVSAAGLGAFALGLHGHGGYRMAFVPDRDQVIAGRRLVTLKLVKFSTLLGEYYFPPDQAPELLVGGRWSRSQQRYRSRPFTELTFEVPPHVRECQVDLLYERYSLQEQAANFCEHCGLRDRFSGWVVAHLPQTPRRPKPLRARVIIPPSPHNEVTSADGGRPVLFASEAQRPAAGEFLRWAP